MLTLIFSIPLEYTNLLINVFYTFLLYFLFVHLFRFYEKIICNSNRPKYLGVRKLHIINRRMFIISAAKIIIFGGIIARLFSLQINENKKYLTLSDKNRLREWRLPPIRGEFLDYFGNVIAKT